MTTNTHNGSEWLDRSFPYWKPELMPSPRQVMADLKANQTRNFNTIIDGYGVTDSDKRWDVEWALESFMIESGDLHLQQHYGWLGKGWKISEDGRTVTANS